MAQSATSGEGSLSSQFPLRMNQNTSWPGYGYYQIWDGAYVSETDTQAKQTCMN